MRVPSSSWLPKKWSPLACVLTSAPMFFAAGTARPHRVEHLAR